ncbi:FUSC family protein [Arthrobacter sp. 35W]|uniref:FUSC family protein n=1 Tax=Arthrobacter sp. 35W TaxID=1132441 RepID=UPI00041B5F40|nr:FUSC family protein [Arthrobacter sp. 35W]
MGWKFQQYLRTGFLRSRSSLGQALLMALCAVLAYLFAERVLGHPAPLFAATSALIALQFSSDLRTRRVLEVALGCTLGVAGGGLLTVLLGSGPVQSVAIVFVFVLLARFLDRGAVFATQMAIQAVLVSLHGATAERILDTSIDAAVGGGFALLFTALAPQWQHRHPHLAFTHVAGELAAVLRECGGAMRAGNPDLAWHALAIARRSQSTINESTAVLARSREAAALSPFRRRRSGLDAMIAAMAAMDLALRNSRVFARRLTYALNNVALTQPAAQALAVLLDRTAETVEELARTLGESDVERRAARLAEARAALARLAGELAPGGFGIETLEGQALVLVLRPLLVDLQQAAGANHSEAEKALPRITLPAAEAAPARRPA